MEDLSSEDPPNTVVKVREARRPKAEITSVRGSTRTAAQMARSRKPAKGTIASQGIASRKAAAIAPAKTSVAAYADNIVFISRKAVKEINPDGPTTLKPTEPVKPGPEKKAPPAEKDEKKAPPDEGGAAKK